MKRSKNVIISWWIVLCFAMCFQSINAQQEGAEIQKVEQYQLFELTMINRNQYADPLRDVKLIVKLVNPEGKSILHYGFFDGDSTWRIRFSPDLPGIWRYNARFSDQNKSLTGVFSCILSQKAGFTGKNEYNPFWMGKAGSPKTLFRSFHVGDRFFASNWDDPLNPDDGNTRTAFLDWLQQNKYNMLSVASLFTNRAEKDRGQGWETPKLWPIDPLQYKKLELILDELKKREITVFPFAGFFGQKGEWPVDWDDQQLYIRYLLARIGHYPNIIFNIAGPEPFWVESGYKNAMGLLDIKRLGAFIDSADVHGHLITVHNETRATQYGDPFIDEPWCDMSTLQGPKTFNEDELFSGLIMNHRRNKLSFAQETLWTGNIWHPNYSSDQIRKNTYTILFSGSILNFADNNGNSSTGFSGTMDLQLVNQPKHDIVRKVSDWFESIPFHQMTVRQDIVRQGFCLANEGVEYFVYLDTIGQVELNLDFPYNFQSEWINAKNPEDKRTGPVVTQITKFDSPKDGDDWILHVFATKPSEIATGNFPDLAVDKSGNLHVVYNRGGLKYKKYSAETGKWSNEENTGCECLNISRSDPDIVIDSKGNPHVFCGNEYAYLNNKKWVKSTPGGTRDTELAIDSMDNIFLVHRGGNNDGFLGVKTKKPNNQGWTSLTYPDKYHKGSNDHVYADISISSNGQIHLVQRHGPEVEVTYRRSDDGGLTWPVDEPVSNDRAEAPHIIADQNGVVYITTGSGELFQRNLNGKWLSEGHKLHVYSRMQPESGIDKQDNLYITSFGGHYNTRFKSAWMGERIIDPLNAGYQIGFVETAGSSDFSYVICEEGIGSAEEGFRDDSKIIIGKLYPDGRIVGLTN